MSNASLTIVGSGIKFISHLTTETKVYIEKSEKVLYLVNEPAIQDWIQRNNKNAEPLNFLYKKHRLRKDCYQEITNYILSEVRKEQHVCVVLYGHPTVFAVPALDAVVRARKEGFDARILPGISAEDCLYADLLVDPGSCGCQSFDATDFLIWKRLFDPSSHLIIWQVGAIGNLGHPEGHDNQPGIQLLMEKLSLSYPLDHVMILYEAAQYPGFNPNIQKITLSQLSSALLSPITTLYIAPIRKSTQLNERILSLLNINKHDLRI